MSTEQIRLDDAQRRVAEHINGSLLVMAPVGTGKTLVLAERMANAIASGIQPERILGLTFTNRACNEMRERVRSIDGFPIAKNEDIISPSDPSHYAACLNPFKGGLSDSTASRTTRIATLTAGSPADSGRSGKRMPVLIDYSVGNKRYEKELNE